MIIVQETQRLWRTTHNARGLTWLSQGDERQEILTAIVSGYFEYAREVGFKHVHLHVPPPTDECAFIFTSRSINVRIRACMHLAHWYPPLASPPPLLLNAMIDQLKQSTGIRSFCRFCANFTLSRAERRANGARLPVA